MADVATLVYDIDSSGAVGAAKALGQMERAAAAAATMSAKVDKQFRAANGQFISQAKAVEQNRGEIERLAAAYNPVLAGQLRFAQAQKDVADAVRLGVITSSQQVDILRDLEVRYTTTANAADGLAVAGKRVGSGFGNVGHQIQNAGYQIGDFAVQVASGQSAVVALAQQLPQLLGGFGAIGAVAGAGVAIAAAIYRFYDAAQEAEKGVDELSESFDSLVSVADRYTAAIRNSVTPMDELIERFGRGADEARRLYEIQAELTRLEFADSLKSTAGADVILLDAYDGILRQVVANQERVTALSANQSLNQQEIGRLLTFNNRAMEELANEFGVTSDIAWDLLDSIKAIGQSESIEESAQAAIKFAEELLAAQEQGATIPPELVRIANEASAAATAVLAIAGAAEQAAASVMAINFPGTVGDDERGSQRGNRGNNFGNADRDPFQHDRDLARLRRQREEIEDAMRGDSRSGRGGGSDPAAAEAGRVQKEMEARFEALNKSFQTDQELKSQQYALDQETLQFALDNRLLTEEAYQQRRLDLNKKYETEMQNLRLAEYASAFDAAGGLYAQLAALNGDSNEKILRNQRKFAAASALISAYQGAAAALADPNISWLGRIMAYGSVLTAGLGAVNAIKGGGSGGGSSRGSTPVAPSSKQEPVKNTLVRIEGDEIFGNLAESILQQIYRQSENGRVIIARG